MWMQCGAVWIGECMGEFIRGGGGRVLMTAAQGLTLKSQGQRVMVGGYWVRRCG